MVTMSAAGPNDPDPIANTEMFRRFVDDDPRLSGAGPEAGTPSRSRLTTVVVPVIAVVLIIALVLLFVL